MTLTLPPTDALNVDMFGVHLGAHGVPAIVAASVIFITLAIVSLILMRYKWTLDARKAGVSGRARSFITLAIVSLMRYKWMLDAGAAGASGRARIAGVDRCRLARRRRLSRRTSDRDRANETPEHRNQVSGAGTLPPLAQSENDMASEMPSEMASENHGERKLDSGQPCQYCARGARRGDSMTLPHRHTAAVPAYSLVVGALLAALAVADARAQGSPATCEDAAEVAVLASPMAPWKGAPLRVIFTVEKPLDGELALIAPNGTVAARSHDRMDGPPYSWFAEVAAPAPGTWRATLTRDGAQGAQCGTLTHEIAVRDREAPRPHTVQGTIWPIRGAWNRATENLYSAWIEKLFDAPLDASPSWKALHEVLRDKSRNALYDHLGLREDELGLIVRPDCADLPYFLRAYFAFKMGLPFGYSKCTRGGGGQPPRCREWWNIENPEPPRAAPEEEIAAAPIEMARLPGVPLRAPTAPPRPVASPASKLAFLFPRLAATTGSGMMSEPRPLGLAQLFGLYVGSIVADGVHSGSGRTALADNNTDYYPVALNQDELRPGTVYADPYGHMLVLVRRVPQSAGAAGVFLAVDAQPDATVSRKRFWRGNFLFAQDPALGGPGFKRFRPIVREKSGALRRLTNEEIAKNPQYGDFALDQGRLAIEDFYDRMDDVMSPAPLDPLRAMQEAITSLEEQVKARVISVENGRKYQASGRGDASMPEGAAIFETTGAWEDFATPARDLRLLIAMDVVHTFPDRVMRRPERYAMPSGKSLANVKAELERVLASELAARKFTYTRSDGSAWTLALKDVIDRMPDLEMAYNVNDCVELRWGATASSTEAATCKRHAPMAQRGKMTEYRAWFHERRRPPRA